MQSYTDKYTPTYGAGHISFRPDHYTSITQGTWAWTGSTSFTYANVFYNSTHNVNDQIDYSCYLDVGTYTFTWQGGKRTTSGIITLLFDTVSQGTLDTYADPDNYATWASITGIVVTTPGLKTISLKMATKNGSSTDYYLWVDALSLYRTA